MQFSNTLKRLTAGIMLSGSLIYSGAAMAADTIKVGVLHSLSGTMAISESTVVADPVQRCRYR